MKSVSSRSSWFFVFRAIRDKDDPRSQRSLSRDMGIALGLTNLLVRRLVRKGWVRIIRIKPNRVRYLLTPAGIAELSSRLVSGGVR